MTKLQTHIVAEDETGIRLDRWFKRHFGALSHGQLQKMLRTGQVRVEGKRAEASDRLEAGASIRVPPQAINMPPKIVEKKAIRAATEIKKLVIYEDDDVIVLNKPAGLAVQGGTGLKENIDDMLIDLAKKGKDKPKLVHRLDRDTSGVLLVARTTSAAAKLSESFRARDTRKIYWGLTLGVPRPDRGEIDAPLVKQGELMIVDGEDHVDAKSALTLYQVLERAMGQAAFVALWPFTGRTHQLRVHMRHIGTPLLGDRLYGMGKANPLPMDELGQGLHLHARRLVIPHPRRGTIDATAPLGPQMRKSWAWFGFDKDAEGDTFRL